MARYRLLMLLGWAALAGGPLAGWRLGRPGADVAVYGGAAPRWPMVLGAAVPSVAAAALLLLNGALRADARARRGELAPGAADRALAAASRWAGWACAAATAFALGTAMLLGGPLGIIGGFALLLVTFSLVGRGRAPAPGYRPNPGRPRDVGDPRNN